jgi:hypothetical protein
MPGDRNKFIFFLAVLEDRCSLGIEDVAKAIRYAADDRLWVIGAAKHSADFQNAVDLFR